LRQDAMVAPRVPGENGSQQACGFHFCLTWTASTGADARWPWLGGRINASTKSELAWRQRV
jgi:hypothetical protein